MRVETQIFKDHPDTNPKYGKKEALIAKYLKQKRGQDMIRAKLRDPPAITPYLTTSLSLNLEAITVRWEGYHQK